MSRDSFEKALDSEYLWYRDEVIDLLKRYSLNKYIPHVKTSFTRWYPSEVVALMDLVDKLEDPSIEVANASVKYIPDFLLKVKNV